MSRFVVFLFAAGALVGGLCPLACQSTDRLNAVIPELESIVADLETGQSQALALRQQLADLEALAADHQKTLASQAELLESYQRTVASLEAHDKQTLDLAQALQDQLEWERTLNRWWLPVTAGALVVAGVEGAMLLWGRAP